MKDKLTVPQLEAKIRHHKEAWDAYRQIRRILNPDLELAWSLRAFLASLHQAFHQSDNIP